MSGPARGERADAIPAAAVEAAAKRLCLSGEGEGEGAWDGCEYRDTHYWDAEIAIQAA